MNITRIVTRICLITACSTPAYAVDSINIPALQAEGKTVIKALASQLGQELKQAVRQEGLPSAIQVCNSRAMPITQQTGNDHGWQIRRTSLKLRNPANRPDSWEQSVLENFARQLQAGANLDKVAFSQVVVNEAGEKVFRMMKAIPVGTQCLACHGSTLHPEVAEPLNRLYPADQARGFKAGDLRGAFSLQKPL